MIRFECTALTFPPCRFRTTHDRFLAVQAKCLSRIIRSPTNTAKMESDPCRTFTCAVPRLAHSETGTMHCPMALIAAAPGQDVIP